LQPSQARDQPIRSRAEVVEALVNRLSLNRRGWDGGGRHLRLSVESHQARALGQLGRTPCLLGRVERRRTDLCHRGLGGSRRRQSQIYALLELADQRRPRLLGKQPVLCAVALGSLHPFKYGDGRRTPLPRSERAFG
jgi:hypothetical protein